MEEKTIFDKLSIRHYTCCLIIILGLLCSITFLLSSCEKEDVPQDSTVPVRFSISGINYPGDETVIRSEGGAGKVLETVEQALSNGWYLESTLMEESAPPIRASYDAIVNGAKFRMVVYDKNDKYIADKEYTYDAATTDVAGDAFPLITGQQYKFVIYSNNTTASAPAYDKTVEVTPNFDLLWGTATATINTTGSRINVSLSHLFTRVKVNTTIMGGTSPVITDIKAQMSSNYTGRLTVANGMLAKKNVAAPQAFTGWMDMGSNSVTSDYSIVYTEKDNPINMIITSLTIKDIKENVSSNISVKFAKMLDPSKSYFLKMIIHKGIWAGSNIYWDGTQLTFEPAGYTGPACYYQGVQFKWGSLVGVSPVDAMYDPNRTTIYVPNYVSSNPTASSWSSCTAASKGWIGGWRDNSNIIPYMNNAHTSISRDDSYLIDADRNTDAVYLKYKGDICQYISKTTQNSALKNYRLPLSSEFGGWKDSTYNWATQSAAIGWYKGRDDKNTQNALFQGVTVSDATGKDVLDFNSGAGFATYLKAVFPASGFRVGDPQSTVAPGTLSDVGTYGTYWSGSAYYIGADLYAYVLYYYISSVRTGVGSSRQNGRPVRCIKSESQP
ncbi:MAG: hypothetical protein LBB85_09645 [Dysgonamonadaceae bacterium]|nr:hypothetical protein [Dysgonamonadaceae bacterium]